MGYRFQFITLAGFHALNAVDVRARARLRRTRHERVRRAAGARVRAEEHGYTATRHQREVGAGCFDLVAPRIRGQRSTLALVGSTEEEQFSTEPAEAEGGSLDHVLHGPQR